MICSKCHKKVDKDNFIFDPNSDRGVDGGPFTLLYWLQGTKPSYSKLGTVYCKECGKWPRRYRLMFFFILPSIVLMTFLIFFLLGYNPPQFIPVVSVGAIILGILWAVYILGKKLVLEELERSASSDDDPSIE